MKYKNRDRTNAIIQSQIELLERCVNGITKQPVDSKFNPPIWVEIAIDIEVAHFKKRIDKLKKGLKGSII